MHWNWVLPSLVFQSYITSWILYWCTLGPFFSHWHNCKNIDGLISHWLWLLEHSVPRACCSLLLPVQWSESEWGFSTVSGVSTGVPVNRFSTSLSLSNRMSKCVGRGCLTDEQILEIFLTCCIGTSVSFLLWEHFNMLKKVCVFVRFPQATLPNCGFKMIQNDFFSCKVNVIWRDPVLEKRQWKMGRWISVDLFVCVFLGLSGRWYFRRFIRSLWTCNS